MAPVKTRRINNYLCLLKHTSYIPKEKSPVQVAINLNIPESQATQFYREYWNLVGLDQLNSLYEKTNGKIWPLWELYYQLIEQRGMNMEQVANVVDTAIDRLPYMESLYEQAKDEVGKMQYKRRSRNTKEAY
jgi:hypothetical protein